MSLALTEKQLNSLDQTAQIERQLTALINTSLTQGKFYSNMFYFWHKAVLKLKILMILDRKLFRERIFSCKRA